MHTAGHIAAHPDATVLDADMHPALVADSGALCGDVALRGHPGIGEPAGQPRIEAAGDGIFSDRVPADKGTHLELGFSPRLMRACHPDGQLPQGVGVRGQLKHLLRAG